MKTFAKSYKNFRTISFLNLVNVFPLRLNKKLHGLTKISYLISATLAFRLL